MTIERAAHMLSNETLRAYAKIGVDLHTVSTKARWNAIDARRELAKRDLEVGLA